MYRGGGYFGPPVPGLPFDEVAGVVPNREGRVVGSDGEHLTGVYATGWIKRGPVGLIGHTKSDATETIRHLVEDAPTLPRAPEPELDAVTELLTARGVQHVTWDGWVLLDAYERGLGVPHGRERIKLVPREDMLEVMRGLRA